MTVPAGKPRGGAWGWAGRPGESCVVPGVGHDGGLLLQMSGDSVCLRLRDGAQSLVVRVMVWEAQVCIAMVSGCGYAREGERLSEEPYEGTEGLCG